MEYLKLKLLLNNLCIIILLACLYFQNTKAQNIINTSGGTSTFSGNVFDYSIGELAAISTLMSPNIILTQGLLQSSSSFFVGIDDHTNENGNLITVYPNPTQNSVHIKYNTHSKGNLSYILYNATGQILIQKSIITKLSEIETISLEKYNSGNYLLLLHLTEENNTQTITFKIQKIN